MLPLSHQRYTTSTSYFPEYLRRIFHYPQMDLEYTFWQMFYLCINPSRVYRTTSYRKQTKNQWARDDPAFVAILFFFLAVASFSFSIAFRSESPLFMLRLIFWTCFIDFLAFGVIVSTIGWIVANRYLRIKNPGIHSVEQSVEWLYAFDIHCNSFFPLFLILYVVQFFCIPVLIGGGWFATFVANSMYAIALGYYYHITFLGYNALPFLEHTVFFLYPIVLIVIGYVVSLILNWNCSIFVMNVYFGKDL
eukprot:TRINITY_DN5082_c0_g1_i1.p1 TRINITY_DN5082_c0_g1~~TRINITY_DN5082_c0_g1_i1.p1  ORF type:complete len:249 (-),score=-6.23 TRINITY_DN5082_c0_g1_i1:2-748(-)